MSSVTITGMTVDTKTLNELLAAQLLKLIKDRSSLTLKTPKPHKSIMFASVDDDDKPCLKCKRNCRKRAVECATCQQWIHYNCGKLEDFIINKIETDQDYVFDCFMCQMNSKTPTRKLVMPVMKQLPASEHTVPRTLSQSILSDEMYTDCVICSKPLVDDNAACERCGSICHIYCMCPSSSDTCLACAAMNSPSPNASQVKSPLIQNNIKGATDEQSGSSVPVAQPTSVPTKLISVLDTLQPNTRSLELDKKESELSQKQRELRQLELKLKKKEDDIKLKEAKIKDYEKNSMKFENKIECLEFRNQELECTLLTLKTRLASLEKQSEQIPDQSYISSQRPNLNMKEQSNVTIQQPNGNPNCARNELLIQGIHDRVSAFVLLKVEKQIERLIDMEQNGDTDSDFLLREDSIRLDDTKSGYPNHYTTSIETPVNIEDSNSIKPQIILDHNNVVFANMPHYVEAQPYPSVQTPPAAYILNPNLQDSSVQSNIGTYIYPFNTEQTRDIQPNDYMETAKYVTGQPVFHHEKTTERKKKPFLRLSNLINLVN